MNRSQYIALFIILIAGGGLFAVNRFGDATSTEATAAAVTAEASATPATTESPATTVPAAPLADPPPLLGESPGNLTDLDGWLQTDATQFADFDGSVRVVQFWTYSCINCKRTLENLSTLYTDFHPLGLEVIGVHSPEFEFEQDPANVQEAAIDLGVVWPIALDTDKTNFRAWQSERRFWPRTFVLDQNGQIRFDRIGEGAYEELNATVAYLIENGP